MWRKFSSLKIIKSDNGFPYAWKAGRVEQLFRHVLERKAQEQLLVDNVMLINPTWLLDRDLAQEIQEASPDFIICHNFVDPVIPAVKQIIIDSGIPHLFIGNSNECRLDFWAVTCDLNFQSYQAHELRLNSNPKKFMCLNRKPHVHRLIMIDYLQQVKDQGYLSSGADSLQVDPDVGNYSVPNDVYTLGDIAAWQDSYLNIVTETVFGGDDFFISEKTWKPIIGGRPFFVYGQPQLRQYLKDQGFDVFEDMIDYSSLPAHATEQHYAQLAVDTVKNLTVQDIQSRLTHNQTRFRSYVYEQWDKLMCLNLQDYL